MSTYEDILPLYVGSWRGEKEIAEHLELIDDVELTEPDYSFHTLRVYMRRRDGMLLWQTDAGCSCPSPFEGTRVSDLIESTRATLIGAVQKHIEDECAGRSWPDIRRDLVDVLTKAKEKGAR